jgi:integrase
VAEELAPPSLLDAVRAVPGLRKGRGEAKELPPVRPPSAEVLDRVLAKTSAMAAALARVQIVCGARAGELVRVRGDQLDRSGPVWKAEVAEHKGEWRGKSRTLYFGPLAQAVLAPLVLKAGGGFLFVNGKGRPYRVPGYRQELQRGCARAGVPEFGTHALRHFAATRIRALADVETARALLGHSDLGLTAEVYAERDERKLLETMARVG